MIDRDRDRPPAAGLSPVDLVRRFRGLRALVIGDAMLDSYFEGTATRLCSEGPVPVVRKVAAARAPGGAANAAANLAALGAEVAFLGLVGRDEAGGLLRGALRERGVDDGWLVEDPEVGTLHKLRIVADDQYVVRFDEGDTRRPAPGTRDRLRERLDDAFRWCDLVVVADYGYDLASDDLLARLRARRAERSCVLAVDAKDLRRYRDAGATVVTPNALEARLAVEPSARRDDGHPHPAEVEAIGRRLLGLIDAEHAAVTMAGDGVLVLDRAGQVRHVPAHPVARANDVGAGDSFTAATALAMASGADCLEATRLAVEAAAIAVAKRRTAVVEHRELLRRASLLQQEAPRSLGALAARLDAERRAGRTIVFTNGVFDLLHAGHVGLLRRAKELGDVLVVGVNDDRSARRLKGAHRPINNQRDRVALVAALDAVDHAILFEEETPAETIRALRPHVHVKGGDYTPETLPEIDAVRDVGARLVILPLVDGRSTSGVIDRIVALAQRDAIGVGR